jgi:hypothetical protein
MGSGTDAGRTTFSDRGAFVTTTLVGCPCANSAKLTDIATSAKGWIARLDLIFLM